MYRNNLLISFDFGTKNIGVAIGQMKTNTSKPLESVSYVKGVPNWGKINNIILLWEPKYIIVGLPLNMDGSYQTSTIKAKKFAKQLRNKFFMPVMMHDERLTTIEAKSVLFKKYGYKGLKKKLIDSESAVIILDSWMNSIYFKK